MNRSLVAIVLSLIGLLAVGTGRRTPRSAPQCAGDGLSLRPTRRSPPSTIRDDQRSGPYLEFRVDRDATAALAAVQLGYDVPPWCRPGAATSIDHQRAVLAAMSQVGVPYRTNTSKEGVGFDCSGLTTYAWGRAGVTLVRQSGSQIKAAAPVDRSTAKAGDLVYYPGHVMMYLGVGDAIIHSVQTGRTVEIDTISGRKTGSVRFGDPAPA